MRKLVIMKRAENAIYKTAQYLAEQYYPSTGEKFINDIIDFCFEYSKLQIRHPLCKNKIFAKHRYACIIFKKKWVIAFKYSDKEFKVYRFVYGARLK
jgi:hypothetical protein